MRSIFKISLIFIITGALMATVFTLWTNNLQAGEDITWGVNYSESQSIYLRLNPDEVYSAIIDDLGATHIKIHINWNDTEPTDDGYDFSVLDRRVAEAADKGVSLILVIGMKTGRWPECHTPAWFKNVAPIERREKVVSYTEALVTRYKDAKAIDFWQIENEPLLQFGTCPDWYYDQGTEGLMAQVAAVRAIDPNRKIIISDSGELSTWTEVAEIADIVGVTMYRSSWDVTDRTFGLNPYTFLTPHFYAAKAAYIKTVYDKPVISIELQAEPWASEPLAEASLAEQALSMNPELFQENILFAKQTGLSAYYFWGAEWWYWMKTKHNQPEIWDAAKQLLAE